MPIVSTLYTLVSTNFDISLYLQVTMMASYFGPLSDGAVGAASLIQNSKQQTHILDLTKTVAESALQFMYSCKEGGGNPKVGVP